MHNTYTQVITNSVKTPTNELERQALAYARWQTGPPCNNIPLITATSTKTKIVKTTTTTKMTTANDDRINQAMRAVFSDCSDDTNVTAGEDSYHSLINDDFYEVPGNFLPRRHHSNIFNRPRADPALSTLSPCHRDMESKQSNYYLYPQLWISISAGTVKHHKI